MLQGLALETAGGPQKGQRFQVRITQTMLESEDVVSFSMRPLDGGLLPEWTPGAHVDLCLPSGLVRQYSLCGDPSDRARYTIAVLRLGDGRGGSREVHDALKAGQVVTLAGPRNAFEMVAAPRYVFVAGGIGITPILPMLAHAEATGADWHLLYGARSRQRMSFLDRLAAYPASRIGLRSDAENAMIDLSDVADAAASGAEIYACGPRGLLDALEQRFSEMNLSCRLHLERFAPVAPPALPDDGSIRVFLGKTGGHVDVAAGCSILEALRLAGHDLPSSCEQGFCGTCETRVLDGTPDHRDTLLTEKERAACQVMMPCVSRAKSPTLTLDI
jgi:ferredoxin-NADP reductase